MNVRQKITLSLLLTIVLGLLRLRRLSTSPTPTCRTAIPDELGHAVHNVLNTTVRRLKGLHATGRNITNLTWARICDQPYGMAFLI